jgi:hypothetical protein
MLQVGATGIEEEEKEGGMTFVSSGVYNGISL